MNALKVFIPAAILFAIPFIAQGLHNIAPVAGIVFATLALLLIAGTFITIIATLIKEDQN